MYSRLEPQALELTARGLLPLPAIPTLPGEKRWKTGIRQSCLLLETIQKEMQDYYDDRSERWQESERAEWFEERLQTLEQVVDALNDLASP